ncbi:MAG TPA: phage head closure protein [Hyphomicrobiaceae bacterium]|nr:phage head closure protein [Hyphomicrobiaceae bacterium]
MTRMAIGALRHRVRIEAAVRTAAPGGGATEAWQEVATVWGSLGPLRGGEPVAGDAIEARVLHDITMRYRPDVKAEMRLDIEGRLFDIKAVLDLDDRRQWITCRCEEQLS